jgi:hypothetical protein
MSILDEIRKMKAARLLEYELMEKLSNEKDAHGQTVLAKKIQYARERILRSTLLIRDALGKKNGL